MEPRRASAGLTSKEERRMEELVADPLVLEAAIALVDECYPVHDTGAGWYSFSAVSEESVSSDEIRKRAQEELMWLRNSVRRLHDHVIVLHGDHSMGRTTTPSGRDEGDDIMISGEREAQARRLVLALEACNRVDDERRLSFGCGDRHVIRLADDARVLTTLRSTLDALFEIMHASCSTTVPAPLAEFIPTITNRGFQYHARSIVMLPFKMSLVADVLWDLTVDTVNEGQMGRGFKPDEIITNVESTRETPWGRITSSGWNGLRRINQADGSIAHLYTLTHSGPFRRNRDPDLTSSNLVAGCAIKYAGWTKIRRVPQYNSVRADRPLVCVEIAQSLVVEPLPGYSISTDRVLRIRDLILDPDNLRSASLHELENRLLDRQLATKPQHRR